MNPGIVKVLISVRDGLEALICCVCRANTSSAHQAEDAHGGDLIKKTPSSPPHSQVRSDGPKPDPNVTTVDNGPRSSSPPSLPPEDHGNNNQNINKVHPPGGVASPSPIHSSSPSPHIEAHDGSLIKNEPTNKTTFTSSPSNLAANTGASFFHGAHDFGVTRSNFTAISVQGESNTVIPGMKALSKRVMEGAAYDSSLRDPPPQCHPGTRVQLIEKVIMWFRDSKRENTLLWLKGPAGVGKSAVIQTIAETLAESNSIGATLFFSRLNNRNDPKRVFITVAFQLAARIPDYQTYITKKIALNPSLLEKGMKDQFRIFIAEPFGAKKIAKGGDSWAVLLDGLDECEGVKEQCKIVLLVSDFVLKFPDAPLVWAISSRPEPHITGTFNDKAVASSFWSEYMPVDSPQACRDVEHYLDTSFKDMRKLFPHLPKDWPSETQFLKLSNGAQGLFAFARTAVRFMEDPNYANPVFRLNLILSIIDRLDIKVVDDHPFALLDALYTQILSSIPPLVWPTTKQILGFVICTQSGSNGHSYPLDSSNRALMKASIILGLELSDVYSSLHKLYSVLAIPDLKDARNSAVTFLHRSFGDYLMDRARSKRFYINHGESVDDVTRYLFQLYLDKPWNTDWELYASKLSTTVGPKNFESLRKEAERSMYHIVTGGLRSGRGRGPFKSQKDRLECLDALSRVTPFGAWNAPRARDIIIFLIDLWNRFREELVSTGKFDEVLLQSLEVGNSDYGSNRPSFFPAGPESEMLVRSSGVLRDYTHELRRCQQLQPEKQVVICGDLPGERIAFFEGTYGDSNGYFCFQYPLAEHHRNPVTSTSAGHLPGARDIVPVINAQGDSRTVAQGMKALSERVAEGAAYDSSLRDPPPRCHPGTRVQLREKIITWFRDSKREKALLWLKGLAGVGKSAVVQTIAESLAESNSIGATLFFSRLNGHSDPQGVFITIAFQLAMRIPDYQTYITGQIVLDPSLLEEEMENQFRIFIAEPFGKKGIGKGRGPWAVLFDGLDECEGMSEQCRIVQLVSEFILHFPDAPLLWAISSRPEPHITSTFDHKAVASSCWSEIMPVDSTQAYQDVKHYLVTMQKQIPTLSSDWGETQFLKLSHGARGLFTSASTALRFIQDPNYPNPISQLFLILSIIDRLDIKAIDGHPFALLDALYTHILSSLSWSEWENIKRILRFIICTQSGDTEKGLSYPLEYTNCGLKSVCIILGLDPHETPHSLHKLYSVLEVPDLKNAHNSDVVFINASFRDYLTDRARSKHFYVDRGESVNDVTRYLFRLYLNKPWDTNWERYVRQLLRIPGPDPYESLRKDAEDSVYYIVMGELPSRRGGGPFKTQEDRLECLGALGQVNPIEVYKLRIFQEKGLCAFLRRLWDEFQEELRRTGLFKMVPLRDLQLAYEIQNIIFTPEPLSTRSWNPDVPNLSALRENQRFDPSKPVMIYGRFPEERIAFFKGINAEDDEGYFCFPYPY